MINLVEVRGRDTIRAAPLGSTRGLDGAGAASSHGNQGLDSAARGCGMMMMMRRRMWRRRLLLLVHSQSRSRGPSEQPQVVFQGGRFGEMGGGAVGQQRIEDLIMLFGEPVAEVIAQGGGYRD